MLAARDEERRGSGRRGAARQTAGAAPSTCSKLSSTSSSRRSPICAARSPAASSVAAIAGSTCSASRSDASSTNQMPSANAPGQVAGGLDREPRLAHPARPRDGDEACSLRAAAGATSRARSSSRPTSGVSGTGIRTVGATGGSRCRERLVLVQDRPVQRLQLGARVDPELVHERRPRGGVGVERLGLPARRGRARASAAPRSRSRSGCSRTSPSSSPTSSARAPALEVGVEPRFERREPQLVQPRDLRLRPGLVRELGERRAAPEREAAASSRCALRSARARSRRRAAARTRRRRAPRPEGRAGSRSPPSRSSPARAPSAGARRSPGSPSAAAPAACSGQSASISASVETVRPRLERQHGEHGALLAAAERQRGAVPPRRQRAEESELNAAAGRHPSWRPTLAPSSDA